MATNKAVMVHCRIRPRVPKADMVAGGDAFVYDTCSVQSRDRGTTFTFDSVFGPDAVQEDLFERAGRPLVDAAMDGMNATIMCYGQTGSGKTYTMTGALVARCCCCYCCCCWVPARPPTHPTPSQTRRHTHRQRHHAAHRGRHLLAH